MATKIVKALSADDLVIEQARAVLRKRAATVLCVSGDKKGDVTGEIKQLLALELAGLDREHFAAAFMGPDGSLLGLETLYLGTSTEVVAPPREVARKALALNATYVAIAHNHINGDARPSEADQEATLHMAAVLASLDVRLLGAYVVTGPEESDVHEIPPPKRARKGANMFDELIASIA